MAIENMPSVISAAEFKINCLALMDEVKNKRQPLVITKYGMPVAKLVATDEIHPSLFGWLKNTITTNGDIINSVECRWEVDDV